MHNGENLYARNLLNKAMFDENTEVNTFKPVGSKGKSGSSKGKTIEET
jgi:hypothetical protein